MVVYMFLFWTTATIFLITICTNEHIHTEKHLQKVQNFCDYLYFLSEINNKKN